MVSGPNEVGFGSCFIPVLRYLDSTKINSAGADSIAPQPGFLQLKMQQCISSFNTLEEISI